MERFSGSVLKRTGGSTSLGPPDGVPRRAHCQNAKSESPKKTKLKIRFTNGNDLIPQAKKRLLNQSLR